MKENKKEEKKYYLSLLFWFIVGAVLGLSAIFLKNTSLVKNIKLSDVKNLIIKISPYMLIVVGLLLIIISLLTINKNKKLLAKNDMDLYDKIDESLSRGVIYTNLIVILDLIFFGLSSFGLYQFKDINLILLCIELVVFSIYLVLGIKLQACIVDMIKQMNPEKKGNVYDKKFQKDWINSCDEMEKSMIYEAGYKSYSFTLTTTSLLFVSLILIGMFFDIGFIAQIVLGIVLLIEIISYCMYSIKIEHKK